jgi:hypothetical protein
MVQESSINNIVVGSSFLLSEPVLLCFAFKRFQFIDKTTLVAKLYWNETSES